MIERANIHDVKGKVLVEFNENQGTFDFPRGRYSIEMYSHFMRMHGTRYETSTYMHASLLSSDPNGGFRVVRPRKAVLGFGLC